LDASLGTTLRHANVTLIAGATAFLQLLLPTTTTRNALKVASGTFHRRHQHTRDEALQDSVSLAESTDSAASAGAHPMPHFIVLTRRFTCRLADLTRKADTHYP